MQDQVEDEEIAAAIGPLAADLLGRHVSDAADDGSSERGGRFRRRALDDQPGDPEVEDLESAVGGDEEILRLEIAMNDARVMGRGETLGELGGQIERLAQRQRLSEQHLAERLPLEQLEDEVGAPLVGSGVMDREDVGMVDRANRPGLQREALQGLLAKSRGGKDLDRHVATEPCVPGAIDLTHPTCADQLDDFVGSKAGSRGKLARAPIGPGDGVEKSTRLAVSGEECIHLAAQRRVLSAGFLEVGAAQGQRLLQGDGEERLDLPPACGGLGGHDLVIWR
ncbi:MAG: hypothetical protein NVS4B10_10770 [Myxococcales bacterium]